MQTSKCPSNSSQVSSTLYPLGKRMGGSQSRLDVVERRVCSFRASNPGLAICDQSLYWAVILYRFITEWVGCRYSDWLRAGRSGDPIPVGARFSAPIQTGPGAHPASCATSTSSFPGLKQPGRGVDHPPPSSAEVKERVELCTSTPRLGLRGPLQGQYSTHCVSWS
jgi:hypothetical protein